MSPDTTKTSLLPLSTHRCAAILAHFAWATGSKRTGSSRTTARHNHHDGMHIAAQQTMAGVLRTAALLLAVLAASAAPAAPPLHLLACPPLSAMAGDDGTLATGTFTSIAAAQAAARAAIAGGHTGALEVELCPGRHPTPAVLAFGPEDVAPGGTTYRGGNLGRAVLDSGVPVTGWAADSTHKGVWSAQLPPGTGPSRQLWVDGARAMRAHSNPAGCSGGPADPSLDCKRTIAGGALSNSTGYVGVPATIPALSPRPLTGWLPGTELVYGKGASGASWTEPRCTVQSVVPGTAAGTVDIIMAQPCWAYAQKPAIRGQGVRYPSDVENSVELLDEPGEWFADFGAGKIYYMPLPGQTPVAINAVLGSVPAGGVGSAITVAPTTSGLTFENLAFSYQTWLEPSGPKGFVDLQAGFWQTGLTHGTPSGWSDIVGVPGVLAMHGVKGVDVKNCTFEHLVRIALISYLCLPSPPPPPLPHLPTLDKT